MSDLVDRVHAQLVDVAGGPDDIERVLREHAPLLGAAEHAALRETIASRLRGLGALDPLLADPLVTDVMINGPGVVWVERDGIVAPSSVEVDRAELDMIIERIVAPIGRRIDPLQPWVDGRLADGSRVNVVGRPVALDGPYVTIRRFPGERPRLAAFVDEGDEATVDALRWRARAGETIVVSGGTGTGKTSLLNALAAELDPATRIITVEDAAELALGLPHVIRLESRPAGTEGDGAVDFRDLVRTALRMRPDRLVIGEIRGPEAFDLMQAFNTGHRGGMATVHANSPADALRRLLTLVLSADTGVPAGVVADQLAAAIDVVVHLARGAGAVRRVAEIVTVHESLEIRPC